MEKSIIVNNKVKVSTVDELIFYYTVIDKVEIDLDTADKMAEAGEKLGGHVEKCANLIDIRKMLFIGGPARNSLAQAAPSNLKANAIVMNSKLQSTLVNLFLRFSKPVINTRIFTEVEPAESWLRMQLEHTSEKINML
jgi:hypothetical protein